MLISDLNRWITPHSAEVKTTSDLSKIDYLLTREASIENNAL